MPEGLEEEPDNSKLIIPTMPRRFSMLEPENNPRHWWHRWQLSTQKFAVILTIGAFITGFTYVLLTNKTSSEGFAIKKLQQQLDVLVASNEKLELQAADLRSLAVIQAASTSLSLEPTDKFEYLATPPGAVALGP